MSSRTPGRSRALLSLTIVCLAATVLAACSRSGQLAQLPADPSTTSPVTANPSTTFKAGSSSQRISVNGVTRTFRLYRPAGLTTPAPLVVMLHGGFGSGSQAEKAYRWNAQADSGRFVVAYPDGLNRAWNTGGGCCGQPAADNVDDVQFITDMIATIRRKILIDDRRIYATGMSNGGIMTYTLACRTSLFAAIGPDAATQLGPCPAPDPLSVIHIHGTADESIRYDGGPGQGVAHIDGPAIAAVNATWRAVNRCATPALSTAGAVTTSVASCPGGRAVELITIAGAGHQWPGSVPDAAGQRRQRADPPSTALDATETIWRFFAAHPK